MTHADDIRVHTQADLHETWRDLMGPLGFGQRSLWLMPIDGEGRVGPLVTIDECEGMPDPALSGNLGHMLEHLAEGPLAEARLAFLRSRPGPHPATEEDRAWARLALRASAQAGLPAEVVHLATDQDLTPLAPDDLVAG